MAGIAMCHIPYKKWMKFFLPCFILWVITACVLLIIATAINYGRSDRMAGVRCNDVI